MYVQDELYLSPVFSFVFLRKEGRVKIVRIHIGLQIANKLSLYYISSTAHFVSLMYGSCSGSEFKVKFSVCVSLLPNPRDRKHETHEDLLKKLLPGNGTEIDQASQRVMEGLSKPRIRMVAPEMFSTSIAWRRAKWIIKPRAPTMTLNTSCRSPARKPT